MSFYTDFDYSKKLLFHFSNRIAVLEHILPEQRLRFSLRKKFDDIAENTTFVIITNCDVPNISPKREQNCLKNANAIERIINDETEALCFCKNGNNYEPDFLSRPRMWSQYSKGTEGVCLVFDNNELLDFTSEQFETDELLIDDITYQEYPLYENKNELNESDICKKVFSAIELKNIIEDMFKDIFFVKHKDFLHENEKRFVLLNSGENFIYFQSSLKALILGSAFPNYLNPLIFYYKEKYHIKVYKMNMLNGDIGIEEFCPIEI